MIDRRTLVGDASPQELARLFTRVPALAEVVARPAGQRVPVGHWAGNYRAVLSPRDLDGLAAALADRAIVVATLVELSTVQFQLVQLAAFHGGTLDRQKVVDEVGEELADELDADAGALAELFLAHRRSSWLTLLPGVSEVIEPEGASLEDKLQQVNSDVIGAILRNLGHRKPPTRKAERIEQLVGHLRDPVALKATIAGLPDEARAVLGRLVDRHPQSAYSLDRSYRRRYWGGGRPPATSPLQVLEDQGLVNVEDYADRVDVWTEVVVALRGHMFESWPRPPALEPAPLDPTVPSLPSAVGTVDRLLALWTTTPAEGLASGGIGVRAVKAAAKTLGETPTTVATLAALAIERGLLGVVTVVPATRKGRTTTREKTGWAPSVLRREWDALEPALRWAHLVQAWPGARLLDESGGLPDRVVEPEDRVPVAAARARTLSVLAELPDDTGVEVADLARHLALRYPFHLDAEAVTGLVAVLRVLGLVPDHGLVGLTRIGRQVLTEPSGVAELIGAGESTFIVQPDHTIVAPPHLEPGLLARLDDYATIESTAGARIYRLDEIRIARALDAGGSADAVLAFLGEHSSVEVPRTVESLVRDVERRHGALRAGAATSYVVSEDPAQLSRAVAVRPAKLRALAPTVAVSTLTRAKLVEVLRGKGLMPVAEGSDGSAVRLEEHAGIARTSVGSLPTLHAPVKEEQRLLARARKLARS